MHRRSTKGQQGYRRFWDMLPAPRARRGAAAAHGRALPLVSRSRRVGPRARRRRTPEARARPAVRAHRGGLRRPGRADRRPMPSSTSTASSTTGGASCVSCASVPFAPPASIPTRGRSPLHRAHGGVGGEKLQLATFRHRHLRALGPAAPVSRYPRIRRCGSTSSRRMRSSSAVGGVATDGARDVEGEAGVLARPARRSRPRSARPGTSRACRRRT